MDADVANAGSENLRHNAATVALLQGARAESYRLGHDFLGTEHILLALTNAQGGNEALLQRLGVDGGQVRGTLAGVVRAGSAHVPIEAERPLTTRTKSAFSYADESARAAGHSAIGPEHLIVGLLRERMNPAAQVLTHHGLTEDKARQLLARARAESRDRPELGLHVRSGAADRGTREE